MSIFDDFASRFGYAKEEEIFLRSIPEHKKKRIENSPLNNIEFASKMNEASKEIAELRSLIAEHLEEKSTLQGVNNLVTGYDRAGSILKKLYPTPNKLYTFIGEKYWAAAKCRRSSRVEFERDGYVLIETGASKRDIKKVNAFLNDLNIPRKRSDMFDHIKTFSNFWVSKERGKFGGIEDINILTPSRIQPIYILDELVGWEYTWNGKNERLTLDQVDHVKTYGLRDNYLGEPMLSSVVVDIEADLHASVYNNTLWQKGGLIKAIVGLEAFEGDIISNENTYISFAKKLQTLFTMQFAGMRGAGSLLFTPNVKGIWPIVNPKDLEGAFDKTSDKIAIRTAELYGCPPEVLGIPRSSQYTNKAAILDFSSLAIDNDNYYVASIVDEYINSLIVEFLDIENIFIRQAGEFSAVSPAAAEMVFKLAQSGCDFMTVNEARVKLFHWEPLPGPEGDQFLGKYKNEAMLLQATKPTTSSKDRTEIMENLFGPRSLVSTRQKEIVFNKHYPNEIRFY